MTYFDDYKKRVLSSGTTYGERIRNDYQMLLDLLFEDSPNLIVVKHNGTEKKVRLKDYQLRRANTVFASIIGNNYKEIYFRDLSDTPKLGDIFEYDNYQWLCVDTQHSPTSNSCVIRKCTNTLKFGDYNLPCFLESYRNTLDYEEIIIPTDKILCVTQYNDISKQIVKLMPIRFVLNNTVWKVIGSDDGLSKSIDGYGLLFLTLTFDQVNPKDDLVNGIAYNDKTLETSPYVINGSTTIILGQDQSYYIIDKNGKVVTDQVFTWSLSNTNAQIISYTDYSCVVRGVSEGEFVLTATSDITVLTKTITIQSSLW
jgi:hypothetical protein